LLEGDKISLICRGEIPSSEELERLLSARHTPGIVEKCRAAKVGIAGCGGLGSNVAIALARLGVGKLVLVDYDVVEPSNLNRQQYFVDQIGKYKVDALRETLARINPYVQVQAICLRLNRENTEEVFKDCNVVAECFDNPVAKRDLLLSIRKLRPRVPLVGVSGIAGHGWSDEIRLKEVMDGVFLVGDDSSEARAFQGLMSPRVQVASGHQANIILRLLLQETSIVCASRNKDALTV
jgi:sulfur carrier protein ThiS adenylyltransferase